MKIAFNRQIRRSPWGGGAHFASALHDLLVERGHEVTNYLSDNLDVIFMFDPRSEEGGFDWQEIAKFKKQFPKTKVIHRINECDARNGGANNINQLLIQANTIADHTVFISNWLQNHMSDIGLKPSNSNVIYNGCRLDWFFPDDREVDLLSLNRKIKLVTHHWSNNKLKGFDLYDALDNFVENNSEYEFTYIGRYSDSYKPRNTHVIYPMYGRELGNELRKHDIYITASRNEPAGMHHIEAAASGLPVLFHSEGGGIVECASRHGLSFSDSSSFKYSLSRIKNEYGNFRKLINYENLSIEKCCEHYYNIILKLGK